jgi:hypothetical protein
MARAAMSMGSEYRERIVMSAAGQLLAIRL